MAQFMVFFNGLILTVTAFFTLSIFIHEMQRETADEKFSLVFSTFESGLSKIEHAFTTASFFVQQQDKEDLTFIRSNIQDISHFSGLFLIEASNGRNFRYVERLGSFPATFNLQQDLQGLNTSNTGGPTKIAFHVGPEKSRSDNFIVFRKKLEVKGRGLLFYGFVPLHTYVTIIRQEYRSVLQSIEVFDNEGDPILNLAAAQGEEDRIDTSPSSLSRKERTFMMAGTPITIVLTLLKDQRSSFLDKIPLLMLLFGFTLTLVGTLYVRNNQKQSNKLAEMNRVLATKNMELNNQIGERERLNARIQKAEKENRTIYFS